MFIPSVPASLPFNLSEARKDKFFSTEEALATFSTETSAFEAVSVTVVVVDLHAIATNDKANKYFFTCIKFSNYLIMNNALE